MSHVSKLELTIKDLNALIQACIKLGFQFVKDQKTYVWYGRWVGDSPLPEGVDKKDLGKCDHAIKVPGCSYEVGVLRKRNGSYTLLWDSWEAKLRLAIGNNAGILKQAYTTEVVRQQATQKGYRVIEKKVEKGIRLILQK